MRPPHTIIFESKSSTPSSRSSSSSNNNMADYDDRPSSRRTRDHRSSGGNDSRGGGDHHHHHHRRSRRRSSRSRSRSRSPDYKHHHRSSSSSSRRHHHHHNGSSRRRRSHSSDDDSHSSLSGGGGGSASSNPKAASTTLDAASSSSGVPSGMPQPLAMPTAAAAAMMSSNIAPPLSMNNNSMMMMPMSALLLDTKINRELFVGNVPPGTSEALLMQFLNGAMRRVGLCSPDATPIINCRTNAKFAFVELSSLEDANRALNLNGIPFLGASLRVSRPSKYAGPYVPSQTWQQLTGQPLPPGMVPVPENTPGAQLLLGGGTASTNPEEKLQRELFVGNTTPEMTEAMLRDFLGRAMEQVGLTTLPGNPILACRVSGKFAFVELRTKEEAANALNLNNIPYLGAQLRVGRPSKYTGPETPHGNWEDILAKFMSGELQLQNVGGGAAAPAGPAVTTASAPTSISSSPTAGVVANPPQQQPTTVVELKQMLTLEDLTDDAEYEDILEDTREECASFGTLKNIIIPRSGPGATKIFLEYLTVEDAGSAINGLAGRTFGGRKVEAVYFDPVKFANQDYSD